MTLYARTKGKDNAPKNAERVTAKATTATVRKKLKNAKRNLTKMRKKMPSRSRLKMTPGMRMDHPATVVKTSAT